jgi:hypothetical protein
MDETGFEETRIEVSFNLQLKMYTNCRERTCHSQAPNDPIEAQWAIHTGLSRCKSTNGLDGSDIRRSSHQTLLLYRLSKRCEMLSLEVRIKRSLALISSSSAKAKSRHGTQQTHSILQLRRHSHPERSAPQIAGISTIQNVSGSRVVGEAELTTSGSLSLTIFARFVRRSLS